MPRSSRNSSSHPGTLATLSYGPSGATAKLVSGAVGGATQRQETYDYNNRLQSVRIQLGKSGSPNANYCLVYNYYSGSNPTGCAIPAQGSSNNGNVTGYYYSDAVNPSYRHTVSYTYDALKRLATAATASSAWGYQFVNDRYGSLTCSMW